MDLICFSHLRWGFVFQRPNHLMSRFARQQRVFFFEEPIYDDAIDAAYVEERRGPDQLLICTPHLPALLEDDCQAPEVVRTLLNGLLQRYSVVAGVLWFYTPMALSYARHLSAPMTVYDCMDELSAFLGAPPQMLAMEAELLQRADVVFTGGHSLYRAKQGRHRNVHAFASSVDADHFGRARQPVAREPSDQAAIPRPRLGFYGVIDERLDLALIEHVAQARPDWQVVMVGPVVKIEPASLPRAPNIHWLGQKPYEVLPEYLAGWDVALMPFALNAATAFISPTKTLEYLAAGKRVVSTAVNDVVDPYGALGIVAIADQQGFVDAIERALASDDPQRARNAAQCVAATSWDRTWNAMVALVAASQATPSASPSREQAYV